MRKIVIKRGDEVIATITGDKVDVRDVCSLDGARVHELVAHGVPAGAWRVQVQDPDFAELLKSYLSQFELAVG